ncbi:peptidase [Achlya hypogyna]|uniref:Peptidase n=1 Tax=Achlya hypogyna TaxID=1202772 RepID=A0A1V9ZRP6_ACHHY|nr:peptidase [Achlya hypogyna]
MRWFPVLVLAVSVVAAEPDRCTAIIVGAAASTTGAPMTTQTADCSNCDFRIVKVPRQSHAPGAMRDVVLVSQDYPRYVGNDHGPAYAANALESGLFNWSATPVIGQIPQVNTTFAYLDGVYGVMNEHQVAFGESTCGARLWAKPRSQGGKALFDIVELSRVAMERATTAREAIVLMGHLAETHGYYGCSWEGDDVFAESGETLTVTDMEEAWIFHILPDDTGASAVWVAQRVPPTDIAAVANQFVIRAVDLNDPANFLGSANMYAVAQRNGFWDGDDIYDFDFTASFAMVREHPNQYYSTRRVWRVFELASPGLALSPTTDIFATDYPFSVPPTTKLGPQDLMRFQRDHYEGTAFDLTTDKASGPYGDPDRFSAGIDGGDGQFERAISLFRTAYSFVTAAHASNPLHGLVWFGPYAPHATTYVPIFAAVNQTPDAASRGSLRRFDNSTLFWANALVGNYGGRFYKFTSPVIRAASLEVESSALAAQAAVQARAELLASTEGKEAAVAFLTTTSATATATALANTQQLFATLVTQFHDGYVMSNLTSESMGITPMGYPRWWLENVGYYYEDGTEIRVVAGALVGAVLTITVLSLAAGFYFGWAVARKQNTYISY